MKYKYWVPSIYPEFVENCKTIIESGEPGLIIAAPQNGILQRTLQLVQDYQDQFPPLIHIRFSSQFEDLEDIKNELKKAKMLNSKKPFGLLLTNIEYLFDTRNTILLDNLLFWQKEYPQMRPIILAQSDLTHRERAREFIQSYIFSRIYYYPYYSREDAISFLNAIASEWNMKLPENICKHIVNICGGQLWLLKETLRLYRHKKYKTEDELLLYPSIEYRLKEIFSAFNREEQKNLALIANCKEDFNKDFKKFAHRVNLVDKNKLTIPILAEYVLSQKQEPKISIEGKIIKANDIIVTNLFSTNEQLMLIELYKNRGKILSKDEIADLIWKDNAEDKFSIWGIEQLISRLRGKLIKASFPKSCIITVRNKGYKFNGW